MKTKEVNSELFQAVYSDFCPHDTEEEQRQRKFYKEKKNDT